MWMHEYEHPPDLRCWILQNTTQMQIKTTTIVNTIAPIPAIK